MNRKKCIQSLMQMYGPLCHRLIRPMEKLNEELTKSQVRLLHILYEYGKTDMTRIAKVSQISKHNTTHIVESLVALGYVERTPDPSDRRRIYIFVTKEGEAYLKFWYEQILDILVPEFDDFTDEELEVLGKSAQSIRQLMMEKEKRYD